MSDVQVLLQALWDVRRELGFDNDGDLTPAAAVSGARSIERFAQSIVEDAAQHRADCEQSLDELERAQAASEGVDMLVAQAERRARVCPTPCDPDCEQVCHEVHQPRHKWDHLPDECRGTQFAQAARRGAVKALRKAELFPNLYDEQGELNEYANAIEKGADL